MDFGMGMPPPSVFKTPDLIIKKLHESIAEGDYCRYVPTEGTHDLLENIAHLENQRLPSGAPTYDSTQVMLVPGGIQAFSLITEALLAAEDTILAPSPSYFSLSALTEHRYQVDVVQGEEFNFSLDDYKNRFKSDVKLAWLCQPNNPTGLYIDTDELCGIIDLATENNVYTVLDESCDNFVFNHSYRMPTNISSDRVVRIRTFSKYPNLAGCRLGYILASHDTIRQLRRLAPIIYGNPNVMGLRAIHADVCLRRGTLVDESYSSTLEANFTLMRDSRDYLYKRLKACPLIETIILPDACYYMFMKLRYPKGSRVFQKTLLREELLDIVPGTLFGIPEAQCWIRVCFARDRRFLDVAVDKIIKVLREC